MNQTYANLEILVADNCTEPKEDVTKIVEVHKIDSRVRYVRHEKNMGPLFNFEFLFSNAKGKYLIIFPDDDHYDDPNLIEKYVQSLELAPAASGAMATVDYIDSSGEAFIRDEPPYQLDGSLIERLRVYLINNITDHIMYGMFCTHYVRDYKFERDVYTPEKFLILHLLVKGPIIDCFGAGYKNIYSFKTREEIDRLYNRPPTKNHHLLWVRRAYSCLPFFQALAICVIYLSIKTPKLSWPIRKVLQIPKVHPGRTHFHDPITPKNRPVGK
ncbi:glycosyltransferase [Cylindrospermopsis curvispora]|uniref:glycosyltransferase n=1 Tax=Cylindrospermopsis curvispora TaxID=747548 RepID=UPI0038B38023